MKLTFPRPLFEEKLLCGGFSLPSQGREIFSMDALEICGNEDVGPLGNTDDTPSNFIRWSWEESIFCLCLKMSCTDIQSQPSIKIIFSFSHNFLKTFFQTICSHFLSLLFYVKYIY
jgi:hypothetical protein